METCVILHNMIIEDERNDDLYDIEPIMQMDQLERGGSTAVPYGQYLDQMSSY